ncbi:hypothetical protein [Streptomyces sp. RerS4]|uniref:hypothetical protein n=1 Tax=Streptomyces sp. RerS4 TaxID=2942449 RepID=UPI00201C7600|nr:hypothetical protein [Streptomyces sp. RerS4]UQX05293.1 hypothetical protein M4D82_15685 [Streptomyces sp. RerS4]
MRDDHKNPPGRLAEPTFGDEQALRGLLAGAVRGLEPSDGALERLRHAVPARRARKRQALVAGAAAVLLAGTVIPAALHLSADHDASSDHSTVAGHGRAQGGRSGGPSDPQQNGAGGSAQPRPSRSTDRQPSTGGTGTQPSPSAAGSPSGSATTAGPSGTGATAGTTGGAGHGPLPPAGAAPGVPKCTADQLGVAGSARAPERDGRVYGSFKVTNVSAKGCLVSGPDTVTAVTVPAGPPPAPAASGVPVAGHTAGDPATGLLPDPSVETPTLVLQPNTGYEVRFAWVPPQGSSCPSGSAGPTAKPEQGETSRTDQAPAEAPASGEAAGETAQVPPDDGGAAKVPESTGVEVSHTPGAGAPVTQTTIPTACGGTGTVYRTGLIAPAVP